MNQVLPEQAGIKIIYASNFLHATLWSFVSAQKLCGKDVNQAIRDFMIFFDVEDLELNSLKQAYYRKNAEFVKDKKSISADAKVIFDNKPDCRSDVKSEEIDKVFALMKKSIM